MTKISTSYRCSPYSKRTFISCNTIKYSNSIVHYFLHLFLSLKIPLRAFQSVLNVLYTVNVQFALMYLNVVVIFLESAKEHLEHIQTVLEPLSRALVSMGLKYWFYLKVSIHNKVHVIQPGSLQNRWKQLILFPDYKTERNWLNYSRFWVSTTYLDNLERPSYA